MTLRDATYVILGLTLLRLLLLAFSQMPIHGDEAQYWSWGKDLDFGYYSKPPLIGWLIGLSTFALGDDPFGVRFLSPVLHGGTALLIMATATHAFGDRIGAWSGITYALLPGVSWASMLVSTDTPLLFAIALATHFYVRGNAVGSGIGLGLGFLSKYAMSYWVLGFLAEGRSGLHFGFAVSLIAVVLLLVFVLVQNL